MSWIIRKTSRGGFKPYRGITCDQANIEPGLHYPTRAEAEWDAVLLSRVNPVGFEVVEMKSTEQLMSLDSPKP